MQPTNQPMVLGGGMGTDPADLNNMNAMCANGLLRIQDILRPREMMGSPLHHPQQHHHNHHQFHNNQHGMHHHGLHPGFLNFSAINMKTSLPSGSPISPPIGSDQSPPATPPMMNSMHSPDSLKSSGKSDKEEMMMGKIKGL